MKAYLKDAIYIPIKYARHIDDEQLAERFEKQIFIKEQVCERCDYFSERLSDVCETCANYGGTIKLHSKVTKGDKKYLKLPFGDKQGVKNLFGDVEFKNTLEEIPMSKKIKFVGTLKDYQVPACKKMIATKGGVLKSAPRTGKTIMSAYTVCKLGLKTLILAAQKDWLDNFYETFVGSESQPAMTNASKKRVGFPKKFEDFEKYDIALCTYQMFLSDNKGKKLLNKIKKMFSVLVVDEVQTVPSAEFSKIVSTLQCTYKHGLSGTPERKDGKEWTAYKLMGPVFYETHVERLRPEIQVVNTEFGGQLPKMWTYMVSKLEKDPKRLRLIIKEALKDVKAGHLVVIPFTRVPVIQALTKAINKAADKKIAAAFYGGVHKDKRKLLIEKARAYKIKVIVGNSKLLSTGINIPRASMLYEVTPSSNQPKAEQRFSRVLTPMENKPQPVIKFFLDDFDTRRNCIRSEFFQTLYPKFRPRIRGDVKTKLFEYLSKKKLNAATGKRTYTGGSL